MDYSTKRPRANTSDPGANTIVPGSPTKKIPIRLIGYETTISLIGSDLG
jgi:hypothetical protein